MKYSLAQQSYAGGRKANEDRVIVLENENRLLLAVADGLGGYPGGDIAAQAAVDALARSFNRITASQLADPNAFFALAFGYAHVLVRRRASTFQFPPDVPKTTCVACLICDGLAYWAHIGDSRLYIFRNAREMYRTQDHVAHSPPGHDGLLTRCLGGDQRPQATPGPGWRLARGDIIVLCSDGAWQSMLTEDIVAKRQDSNLQVYLDTLLRQLEQRNPEPSDNLSAIYLAWDSSPKA